MCTDSSLCWKQTEEEEKEKLKTDWYFKVINFSLACILIKWKLDYRYINM